MSNAGKASREALETLHGTVATILTDKLRSGEATAADIQAAIKFLKDNGIDGVPAEDNPLGKLRDSLPFIPEQEEQALNGRF